MQCLPDKLLARHRAMVLFLAADDGRMCTAQEFRSTPAGPESGFREQRQSAHSTPAREGSDEVLGRKRAGVALVRAWCSPFDEEGPAGELLALVDQVLASIPALALEGSINYGYTQPMSSLRRALAKLKPAQLDALLVQDEAGEVICSVGARARRSAIVRARSRSSPCCRRRPSRRRIQPARLLMATGWLRLRAGTRRRFFAVRGADPAPVLRLVDGGGRRPLRLAGAEVDVRAARYGPVPANVHFAVALARLVGSGLQLPWSVPSVGDVVWRPSSKEKVDILRVNPSYGDLLISATPEKLLPSGWRCA